MDAGRPDHPSPRPDVFAEDWLAVPSSPRPDALTRLVTAVTTFFRSPGRTAAVGVATTGLLLMGMTVLRLPSTAPFASTGAGDFAAVPAAGQATFGEAGPVAAAERTPATDRTDAVGTWLVDVAGAVARPGLYRVPAGSRVGDAVAAAGGFSPDVDATLVAASLNLAAPLTDGEKILVPARGTDGAAAVSGAASPPSPGGQAGGLLDLNRATQAELEALPGIGPVTAVRIIESRTGSRFGSVDDLASRDLLKSAVFKKVRPLVTVGG